MTTTALLAEYIIVGGTALFPIICLLVMGSPVRVSLPAELLPPFGVVLGIMIFITSYVFGVLLDLISRRMLKRRERLINQKLICDEFSQELVLISKHDWVTGLNAIPDFKNHPFQDATKLLRVLRYYVYVHGGNQSFSILTIHNHLKRITRSMVIVLPIVLIEIVLPLVIHRRLWLAVLSAGILGSITEAFYYGYKQSVRSHSRSVLYSFISCISSQIEQTGRPGPMRSSRHHGSA
jgi:hypothetical protein